MIDNVLIFYAISVYEYENKYLNEYINLNLYCD